MYIDELSEMARPRVVTELQVWMLETGRTDVSLAREINALLPDDRRTTERSVARWRKGLALPRYPEFVAFLTKLSEGRVTADCFIGARIKEIAHSANALEAYRQETGSSERPADTTRRWRRAVDLGESAQFASRLPDLSPKAKRALGNDLQVWMLETGRTDVSLATELSAKLQGPSYGTLSNRQINVRTVGRWRLGLMVPRHPQHIALLTELSEGRVTANSFIKARDRESPAT
jgi:hypothetical protein